MSKRNVYHVTHESDHRQVKKEKAERAVKTFDTKEEAVDYGRDIAKGQAPGQLKIHNKDGKIQAEHTYGQDLFPPKE